MSYISFTGLPGSSRPTAPAGVGRAVSTGRARLRFNVLLALAAATEFLLVAISAFLAAALYHRLILHPPSWDPARYIPQSVLIATLNLLVSVGHRQYLQIQTQPRHAFLWNGVRGVFVVFSFVLAVMFVLKISEDYSRAVVLVQAGIVGFAVLCARALWFSLLQRAIALDLVDARRAILIGEPTHCLAFSARATTTGIRTVHSLDFPDTGAGSSSDFGQIVDACRPLRADDVVILISHQGVSSAIGLARALSELPVDVHVVPVGSLDLLAMSRITQFGNMVTMRIVQCPISCVGRAIKRAFDIAVATIGLICLSPVFVIVSIAVKLDSPGPVFFRQTRHGYNNELIRVLKFRSMAVTEDGDNFTPAAKHDPRVTRLGRLMRRTNIDELPQLLNVLLGDMSVVGPRPHATSHNEAFNELISSFSRRHNVKPGITGWAQVNGYRGRADTLEQMQRRVEYDLYYIDNWSLLFDLRIIILTLFSKEAYLNAY